jgi:RNA polymerase sigma factor (sigma-70 family)
MSAQDPTAQPERAELPGRDTRLESTDGHRKALGDLARDQQRALVRYLTARMGSVQEAKEVAQETYAKLLALDQPQAVGFLLGYMYKIASNLVVDRQRQRAGRARLATVALFQTKEYAPSPESQLYTEQQLKLVGEALAQLPAKCVEAFMLRIVEERSVAETATQMNISERMVKIHVARAAQFCESYLDAVEAIRRMPK